MGRETRTVMNTELQIDGRMALNMNIRSLILVHRVAWLIVIVFKRVTLLRQNMVKGFDTILWPYLS